MIIIIINNNININKSNINNSGSNNNDDDDGDNDDDDDHNNNNMKHPLNVHFHMVEMIYTFPIPFLMFPIECNVEQRWQFIFLIPFLIFPMLNAHVHSVSGRHRVSGRNFTQTGRKLVGWFGTWLLFSIRYGMSSFPFDVYIFQRGRSTTNQKRIANLFWLVKSARAGRIHRYPGYTSIPANPAAQGERRPSSPVRLQCMINRMMLVLCWSWRITIAIINN